MDWEILESEMLTVLFQIRLISSTKKHSPIYTLQINSTSASGEVRPQKTIESSFTRWFSSDGRFHAEQFQQWLAEETGVLETSDAAPKSSRSAKK
jgi:hypothetical protein